jgi:carboxymethylenebutenolidase
MNRSSVDVPTADGVADCYLAMPADDGPHPGDLLITGYCFGGWLGWTLAAAHPDRVAALAGFHAGHMVTESRDSAHLLAPRVG